MTAPAAATHPTNPIARSPAMATCPIRLLDGGLGTSLQDRYGVVFSSTATPLWSSHLLAAGPHSPDEAVLQRCQADFCRAGADVLETATYQVSAAGLARTCTTERPDGLAAAADVHRFLERAVAVAEAACEAATTAAHPAIALSLGPYGACMVPSTEYSGAYDAAGTGVAALRLWHADRLQLFDAAVPRLGERVRYVAYETVPRLDEIAAVRALYGAGVHTVPPSLAHTPYWISCVFPGEDVAGPVTLPDGTPLSEAVEALLTGDTTPPWGIGINCTKMVRLSHLVASYEAAIGALVAAGRAQWPALVLYPDGTNGEVYNTTTQAWEMPAGATAPQTPWETQLSAIVLAAAGRGTWREILVGGCCKSTDRDIRALKEALQP